MALMTGPVSPYIDPTLLVAFPLGISWQTIPDQRASDQEKYAAQVLICQQATAMADACCNQVLRSTVQSEQVFGPNYRMNQLPNGNTRVLLSQWPITAISAIQVAAAASFPWQWTPVTTGAWAIERPSLFLPGSNAAADSGTGGQSIQIGPGWINWALGRGGYVVDVTYASGWPHAGITQAAAAGDAILHVDDCTGWAPATIGGQGCNGVIQDNAGGQEAITCLASSVATGPGILTLSAPLTYAHSPGILVSAMPGQIQWGTALFCASIAMTRGSTATTIQTIGPRSQQTASGADSLAAQAAKMLAPFARVT
jgi:hypothetical protein